MKYYFDGAVVWWWKRLTVPQPNDERLTHLVKWTETWPLYPPGSMHWLKMFPEFPTACCFTPKFREELIWTTLKVTYNVLCDHPLNRCSGQRSVWEWCTSRLRPVCDSDQNSGQMLAWMTQQVMRALRDHPVHRSSSHQSVWKWRTLLSFCINT